MTYAEKQLRNTCNAIGGFLRHPDDLATLPDYYAGKAALRDAIKTLCLRHATAFPDDTKAVMDGHVPNPDYDLLVEIVGLMQHCGWIRCRPEPLADQ